MKTSIQPKDYRFVVFADEQAKFSFLTRSTAKSDETIKWTDGNEYPLVKMQISSASHSSLAKKRLSIPKVALTASRLAPRRQQPSRANSATRLQRHKKKLPRRQKRPTNNLSRLQKSLRVRLFFLMLKYY